MGIVVEIESVLLSKLVLYTKVCELNDIRFMFH